MRKAPSILSFPRFVWAAGLFSTLGLSWKVVVAAEVLARETAGRAIITVYDRMPSLGRKLLIAGRGGLNLTHAEGRGDDLAGTERTPPAPESWRVRCHATHRAGCRCPRE